MNDTFDLGGGGGNSFSFGPQGSQPGAHIAGTVVDLKEVQETNYDTKEPEFWPNGDPKMQYRLTLQTELRDPNNPGDTGQRDVYLNGYRKPHPKTGTSGTLYAVLEAVRAATGGTQIKAGAKVTLQWVSGMGFTGDPRHYQAWYEAPSVDLAGPAQPAAAAPPVQQAPPAPAAAPAQPAAAATASPPAPAPAVAAAPTGHSPETIAALQAAGIDPANVPVQV